jgi:KUP system potassium uptake protein
LANAHAAGGASGSGGAGGRARSHGGTNQNFAVLVITSLGGVFGDIGTSPLYALRECLNAEHGYPATEANILGLLSMFFWSLNIVVSLKYVLFIMRAHNRGEGGILALEALARRQAARSGFTKLVPAVTMLGLFGSALLFGDGIITPAISVLSALEGLKIATPLFKPYVVPLTAAVLVALFAIQRYGTARIGAVFGPITLLWFLVLGALGLVEIVSNPGILAAMHPIHAIRFFMTHGPTSMLILGTVFLCVTGGEAMYADMGHFGRRPIKWGWFAIVLPCLVLNYFGQGALLLRDPSAIENPFYRLAPDWMLLPLVGLATAASVIASQALISGVFSLARQAVQIGYSPRMAIIHTNRSEIGQIYVPLINWMLLIGALWLVFTFQSSSNIAHAYGIAVSLTMLITMLLAALIARYVWKWNRFVVLLVCVPLIIVDLAFFGANAVKVLHGGWIPIVLACAIQLLATTWIRGRALLARELSQKSVSLFDFLAEVRAKPPLLVPGTAVFMTGSKEGTPFPFANNMRHNKVMHDRVLFLTFITREVPHVPHAERVEIDTILPEPSVLASSSAPVRGIGGLYRVIIRLGFMDVADVQAILKECVAKGLKIDLAETTFFLGRETVLATRKVGMVLWRERLFAFMGRNAQSPALFFNIPPAQVIEVGMQVEI